MEDFQEKVFKETKKSIRLQQWQLFIAVIGVLVGIIGVLVVVIGPDDVMDFLKNTFGGGNEKTKPYQPPPPESISKLIEDLKKEPLTPKRLVYLKEHINFIPGPFSLAELNNILDEFALKEHKFEITQLLQSRIKDDRPASELERFLNQFNNYQRDKALRLLKGRN